MCLTDGCTSGSCILFAKANIEMHSYIFKLSFEKESKPVTYKSMYLIHKGIVSFVEYDTQPTLIMNRANIYIYIWNSKVLMDG